MNSATEQHVRTLAGYSPAVVCLAACIAIAVWASAHALLRLLPERRWIRWPAAVLRVGVGFAAALMSLQVAMRFLLLTTNWPQWSIAIIAAGGVETTTWLYGLERKLVSRRMGRTLVLLRMLLVLLVAVMLAQPVLSLDMKSQIRRVIAVLIDDSGSMRVSDKHLSDSERVRLAEMLGVPEAGRRIRMDEVAWNMDLLRRDLLERRKAILGDASGDRDSLVRRLGDFAGAVGEIRTRFEQQFAGIDKTLQSVLNVASQPAPAEPTRNVSRRNSSGRNASEQPVAELTLAGKAGRDLSAAKVQAQAVRGQLDQLASLAISGAAPEQRLADLTKRIDETAGACSELSAKLREAGDRLDEQFFASLPETAQKKVMERTGRSRFDLAVDSLTRRADTGDGKQRSLVERLADQGYTVQTYRFAGDVQAMELSARTGGDWQDPSRQETALGKALDELPGLVQGGAEQVSGRGALAQVVLVSDGAFTDALAAGRAADRLVDKGVKVDAVLVGSQRPMRDAAVLAIDSPSSVFTKDKAQLKVTVRLDGLAGEIAAAGVYRRKASDDSKASTEPAGATDKIIQVTHIRVPAAMDSFETTFEAVDGDTEQAGDYQYVVQVGRDDPASPNKVLPFPQEAFDANNVSVAAVSITDDRTRVLIVEDHPRWEFRYLRNLLADRDTTVHLQYVMLNPDQIEGLPRNETVAASAGRPYGEVEAGALPGRSPQDRQNPEKFLGEWLAFDVIVLGDVGTNVLEKDDIAALDAFVRKRGGTLVVIAGPNSMPGAFAGTELESLLPVKLKRTSEVVQLGVQSSSEPFRIALSDAGGLDPIMKLRDDPADNAKAWNDVPEAYWRYPIEEARAGATVLAYAAPETPPNFLKDSAQDSASRRQRDEYQRKNALVTLQPVGNGKVVFLSFDSTWRLRYRVGDTYHHKFWGQLIRWATADRLPAGSRRVRVGPYGARYAPDASVNIEAQLLDKKLTPTSDLEVEMNVMRDGKAVMGTTRMPPVAGRPGRYELDLGKVGEIYGPGEYRVEFTGSSVKAILSEENYTAPVAARFQVDKADSVEKKRLNADPAALNKLAERTGGLMTYPLQAPQLSAGLAPGLETRTQHREWTLWDSAWLLSVIVGIATAEWILRKRSGLA